MKKVLIVAALSAAAFAATPLFADQGNHRHGRDKTAAAENCPMTGDKNAQAGRHAEMQKRMQEMHVSMHSARGEKETQEHAH